MLGAGEIVEFFFKVRSNYDKQMCVKKAIKDRSVTGDKPFLFKFELSLASKVVSLSPARHSDEVLTNF